MIETDCLFTNSLLLFILYIFRTDRTDRKKKRKKKRKKRIKKIKESIEQEINVLSVLSFFVLIFNALKSIKFQRNPFLTQNHPHFSQFFVQSEIFPIFNKLFFCKQIFVFTFATQ